MTDNPMPVQNSNSVQPHATEQPDPFDPAPHRDISIPSVALFFLALGITVFNLVTKRLKK